MPETVPLPTGVVFGIAEPTTMPVPAELPEQDPYAILERGFFDRTWETVGTIGGELTEEGHRLQRSVAATLVVGTQAFERGRGMVRILPWVFEETLRYSDELQANAYQAGGMAFVAIGGVYVVAGYAIGQTFKKGMDTFPKTTAKVRKNHPVMVDVIAGAVDGFPTEAELGKGYPVNQAGRYEVGPYDTKASLLGKLGLAFKRGNKTAYLFGTTPHSGVAEVQGHSDESSEKRLRVVTAEAGLALGGLAVSLVALINNDAFGLADEIMDVVKNGRLLTAASLGLIGLTAVLNKLGRMKQEKQKQIA